MSFEDKIFDMGYSEFAKKPELGYSLAWSIYSGLMRNPDSALLCDYSYGNKDYSAKELLVMSLAFAQEMKKFTNKKRIGIAIPPCMLGFIVNYACVFAKIIPVNLNFTMGADAIKSCVETADIDCMISLQDIREKFVQTNQKFPWSEKYVDAREIVDSFDKELLKKLEKEIFDESLICKTFEIEKETNNNNEATLIFTSGSEGKPKAAIITERNIIGNCLQVFYTKVFAKDDLLLANLPIFHCFGLLFEVWHMAICSQKTVTLFSPLDIKNNIKALREKRPTVMIGSPTFFRAYLKRANPEDLKSLRAAIAGAEKTPAGFHDLWNNTFHSKSYTEGYGLTEATPVVAVNLADKDYGYFSTGTREASVGKLFVGMQACLRDVSTLEVLPLNSRGLLCLRGPNIFAGYLDNDDATKKALDGDWLISGDISRIDADGFLYIEGRLKRFSKIAGEMVPHITVETALSKAMNIEDSEVPLIAVSQKFDSEKGEVLVLVSAIDVSLAEVKEYCRQAGLSNLWMPKSVVKVDKIPLLPSGKLDLSALGVIAKQ